MGSSTASDSNHGLPPRYEIRPLTSAHKDWAAAIIAHSQIFFSPLWLYIYPHSKTQRSYSFLLAADYLVKHQIDSGLSYGIFDNQYKFRSLEAEQAGGKLRWDLENLEASEADLLEQMDFPLVSVAMSYDSINPLDASKMGPLIEVLPTFATVYHVLAVGDKRDPASWTAIAPGEVLFRNATSTRREYEGQGLMKKLAWFLLREAKAKGFRGVQIESGSDAVAHVWENPPDGFQGEVISELNSETYEMEVGGKVVKPMEPSKQMCKKIYVTL